MKVIIFSAVLILLSSFTGQEIFVTANDMNKLCGDPWYGYLITKNDSCNCNDTANVVINFSQNKNAELEWKVEYTFTDEGINKTGVIGISKKGDEINGERISDRAVTKEGVLKLITLSKTGGILTRRTYWIGEEMYSLVVEEKSPGKSSFLQKRKYEMFRGVEVDENGIVLSRADD